MLDKMNTAQYRKKSEKAKASRQAAGLHTGGSRPHAATRADLAQRAVKEGREPESVTAYDVFLHTHKRRADGSFVDARAQATDAAYREALSQIEPPAEDVGKTTPTQTPSSMAARYDDVFVESVGGFNKGRVYGVGSLAASLQGATPRYPPPPASSRAPVGRYEDAACDSHLRYVGNAESNVGCAGAPSASFFCSRSRSVCSRSV
ncbi:putative formin-like protein 5 [Iris pallida]|uniref:Formin-like protein 5 n=1 Tax=Iris pallida TaxID=29817 RepID=A0AAX6FMH1_IRIPA|nr:putative formin-like protein 5 [Iris pallida]